MSWQDEGEVAVVILVFEVESVWFFSTGCSVSPGETFLIAADTRN